LIQIIDLYAYAHRKVLIATSIASQYQGAAKVTQWAGIGNSSRRRPSKGAGRLIADARNRIRQQLDGEVASARALARELGLHHRHMTRALPLAFLAPN